MAVCWLRQVILMRLGTGTTAAPGPLIWAAVPPKADAHAALVRQRVEEASGHAMLIRAPDQLRRNLDVFHPQPGGLADLSERVRRSFDPKSILEKFLYQTPRSMETASRDVRMCGAIVDVDEATGRARGIASIQEKLT